MKPDVLSAIGVGSARRAVVFGVYDSRTVSPIKPG